MPVYKDRERNTWYVKGRYRDWQGNSRWLTKRGFAMKRDAVAWEAEFRMRQAADLDMPFGQFYQIYREDKGGRLKDSTWETKESIIEKRILPYFENMKMREISSLEVIRWQNELMKQKDGRGNQLFSQTYLKTLHNQLSAIFNHAVRHYKLKENPARIAGGMGEKHGNEMEVWTQEEYQRFAEEVMDKPVSFYCFEVLYWCGIREGELLALCRKDFDFRKREVVINKTYHRRNGQDVFTTPKTKQSNRKVTLPQFLCEELQEYFALYPAKDGERAFPVSKNYLQREMVRGVKNAGVKKIRIHDLRHSHVSLLISRGFSVVDIAKRLGHEGVEMTMRYAHMFPGAQQAMVSELESMRKERAYVC